MYTGSNDKACSNDETKALYKSLAASVVDVMDASALHSLQGAPARAASPADFKAALRNTVSHECLTDFVTSILTEDLPLRTIQKLFFKLTTQVDRIDVLEFEPLWLPFLRDLMSYLVSKAIPLTIPRYQHFCIAILEAYVKKFVGKEPRESSSLARREVDCSCPDCGALNRFLLSPRQKVERFKMGQGRRDHLLSQLQRASIDFTHTTDTWNNPHTLIVTKSFNLQAKEKAAWQSRADAAKKQFAMFRQEDLVTLLGQDYSKIVELESARVNRIPQAGPVNNAQAGRQSAQPPPVPRSGQVIQPQQHQSLQSACRPHQGPLPTPVPQPYRSPYPQPGFTAQQPLVPAPPAQPAVQSGQLPGIKEIGVSPAPQQARPSPASSFGVMTQISGNQTRPGPEPLPKAFGNPNLVPDHEDSRRSGPFPKAESPLGIEQESGRKRKASEPLRIKQESGKKRKSGGIEPEVIDLTGDD